MHELSVCQALLGEASKIAAQHNARRILSISVQIGPLSGVDAGLLAHAFDVARTGTAADTASLRIEVAAVRVRCRSCGSISTAAPSDLLCGACHDYRVQLIEGDELLLASLEFETEEDAHV